jgi:hypothetical protein
MLLLKLDWMASGRQRKRYITNAQLKLEKSAHELSVRNLRARGVITAPRGG